MSLRGKKIFEKKYFFFPKYINIQKWVSNQVSYLAFMFKANLSQLVLHDMHLRLFESFQTNSMWSKHLLKNL